MQLLGGRGPGWSRNSPSVGCHNLDENPGRRRSTASPRVPGRPEEPACWLLLQPASLRNPHRNHPGRGACGIGPRIRDCCRLISSKSYLERLGSHPRALCLPEFPHALLAGSLRGSAGERPAGDLPPPVSQENPRSSPDAVPFPETPLSRRVAGRPAAPHADDPPPRRRVGDPAEKHNRRGEASPELGEREIGKPRPTPLSEP